MPTYRNDTDTIFSQIEKMDGSKADLAPGEVGESKYFLGTPGLTLISETPYYNPLIGAQMITLDSSYQNVPVDLKARQVVFIGNEGSITAYAQSETNAPPLLENHDASSVVIPIKAGGRFSKLRVAGSGTWRAIQTR